MRRTCLKLAALTVLFGSLAMWGAPPVQAGDDSTGHVIRLRIDEGGHVFTWGARSRTSSAEGWSLVKGLEARPEGPEAMAAADRALRQLRFRWLKIVHDLDRLPEGAVDATLAVDLDPDAPFTTLGWILAAVSSPVRGLGIARARFATGPDDEPVLLDWTSRGRGRPTQVAILRLRQGPREEVPTLTLAPEPVQRGRLKARTSAHYTATWNGYFGSWTRSEARRTGRDAPLAPRDVTIRTEVAGPVSAWSVVRLLKAAQEHGTWSLTWGAPGLGQERPTEAWEDETQTQPRGWPRVVEDPVVRIRVSKAGRLERLDAQGRPTALDADDAKAVTELVGHWTFAARGKLTFVLGLAEGASAKRIPHKLVLFRALLSDLDADKLPRGRGLRRIRVVHPEWLHGSKDALRYEKEIHPPDDDVLRLLCDRRGILHRLTAEGLEVLGPLDGTDASRTMTRFREAATGALRNGHITVDLEIEPGTPEVIASRMVPEAFGLAGIAQTFDFTWHVGPDGVSTTTSQHHAKPLRDR